MAMDKQMELFEDGGLMDEGGMVDEVSGNEVPPGSTREEVRDDIPAQLSEGEFVFPADVVRYIGLENLMRMRQEAKMGLSEMEAMGQMGNSEEATMPDDLPFDMYDLEVEDDGVQEFAQGGVVQAAQGMFVPPYMQQQNQYGIAGYQPSQFTGTGQQQQQPFQPSQPFAPTIPTGAYTPPTQQFTPTTPTGVQIPTFASMQPTNVTYYDANGNTIEIPVDANGNPLIPVPTGFSKTKPETTEPTTPTSGGAGGPYIVESYDDGPSPEEQKAEQERIEGIQDRIAAAEALGFTNKQSVVEALAPLALSALGGPLGGLAASKMNPEEGTILPDGTVADGKGNSFDPITGEQVGATGGALGAVAKALGFSKPAEMPQSLKDKIGLSDAQRADKDLEDERLEVPDVKAGTKSTKVETTQVTKEKGTGAAEAIEETQTQLDDRIKEALGPVDKTGKTANELVSSTLNGDIVVRGEYYKTDPVTGKVTKEFANKTIDKNGNEKSIEYDDGTKLDLEKARQAREEKRKQAEEAARKKAEEAARKKAAEEAKQRAEEARRKASSYGQEMGGSGGDDYQQSYQEAKSAGADDYGASSAAGVESYGISGLAKGGLAKQMKQSGLASKK
jgi:hypothetical protein